MTALAFVSRCLKICNIVPQFIKCYISKEFEFAFFPKQIPSMFCEFGVFPVCWLDTCYLVSLCCWRRACWKCTFFHLDRPWHWAPWSRCSGYGSFWGGLPGRLEAGTSWTPDPASHPHRWPRDPWSWTGHLEIKKAMRNDLEHLKLSVWLSEPQMVKQKWLFSVWECHLTLVSLF